jgi:HD-GYP domain-containing protein (c-di-GMP phosphodiesterase class II)
VPQEAGFFVIVDGAGIIRAFGPPRADGSPLLDLRCIGTPLFESLPDLPHEALAEAIAATVRNGRLGPRHVPLTSGDPFGTYIEVCAVDGIGQVMLRWVKGVEGLARALVGDLSEAQTLEAVVNFLAARLAPAGTLGFIQPEQSDELLALAKGGFWPVAAPPRWGRGILKTLARSGGLVWGLGGEADLGPEERPLIAGPWLACGLLPKAGPPGALLVARQPGAPAFGPGDQAVLRSTAALAEMGLGKARLLRGLTKIVFDTVNALAVAIEAKDPYTEGHVQRVTQYSLALGEELGLPEDQLQILQFGALLHDVGKIGVRAEILNKAGKLDPLEVQEIRAHPLIGEHIIRDVDFLQPVREIVRYHQERYDGTGYPEGLQGEGIPLLARIIAVADAYDSMAADRPYRKSLGDGAAVRILREEAGRQFDPVVVEAFLRIVDTDPGAA